MSHRYDPREGVIIKVATPDDMMEVKSSLSRIEERLAFYCNRNILDTKKKAYQEGWDACNSEALKFCKWMAEVIAMKCPAELEDFFNVENVWDIFEKLKATGVVEWDNRLRAYKIVD